jgi:nucleoside-diphosphate-sugar epimerase
MERTADRRMIVGGDLGLAARVSDALGRDVERFAAAIWPDELKRQFERVDQLVVLGAPTTGGTPAVDGTRRVVDVDVMRAVLDAASSAGVGHLVVVSTAMVYGAWSNNAVPLTEAAPLRPVPGVAFATESCEIERMVVEWRDDHPSATVAVLRPVVTVRPDDGGWLKRSPWVPPPWRASSADVDPPMQYLLIDDLVAAIELASRRRLDGAFNVAPEGWIPAEVRQELVGPRPRVAVPESIADALTARRLRHAGFPAEVAAYQRESWVVASDALRAAGWRPIDTNEQAFVEAETAGPLASMDARRRQVVSLAAVGVVVAAAGAATVAGIRRFRRSHRAHG